MIIPKLSSAFKCQKEEKAPRTAHINAFTQNKKTGEVLPIVIIDKFIVRCPKLGPSNYETCYVCIIQDTKGTKKVFGSDNFLFYNLGGDNLDYI